MRFYIAGLLSLFAVAVRADEPAIIAKARAYLGSESALTAVNTLHFTCRVVRFNPAFPDDQSKGVMSPVEVYFEKPSRERMVLKMDNAVIEQVIDGYDGWYRKTALGQPDRVQMALQSPQSVENMQADAWENLYFYRDIEAVDGKLEDRGPATIDGIACEEVVFFHSPVIIYHRYFDRATGRLVYTETEQGSKIWEKGEIISGGIRFPQSLTVKQTSSAGKVAESLYLFDKIAINEVLPDSMFTMPLVSNVPAAQQ